MVTRLLRSVLRSLWRWYGQCTEPERWREQGRPRAVRQALPTVQHHRTSIFFWQWSHWFHLCCVLLTTHQCPVSCKQTIIRVFACHWYARWCLISFFSTIWNYSRNGGRERELNYLFFISLSLSFSLSLSLSLSLTHARTHARTHTHTHTHTD